MSEQWVDKTLTYSQDGEAYQAKPTDILMAAARMQRDGMSLEAIMTELDVKGLVSSFELERAIKNYGMPLLEKAIREGKEPAESKFKVAPEVKQYVDDPDDEDV